MSAIFGIWNLDGSLINKNQINKMKDTLTQYGRDSQDIYIDKNIALGSCLNKISIYSQNELPIQRKEEIIFVADAQVYNRDELIYDHRLTDNAKISNNELILAAYQKWGEDCPKYLNGDFAFAIWECQKQQLLIVRDHLGVRPLYYFYNQNTFAFATDYRALLALPFVDKQINEVKLYALLSNTYHIDPEATYFEQIQRLPQAHTLRVNLKGMQKQKYWTPGGGEKILFGTETEYIQALYSLVEDAIKKRLHSTEQQFGAELSGGLDSSVITVLAARELKKENKELPLFSWGPSFELFAKQPRDERIFIEMICQQEGLECRYYNPHKPLAKKMADSAMPMDGGSGDIFIHEFEEMREQGVRLILTGWGGDQGISHRANLKELFFIRDWRHFIKEACYSAQGSPWRLVKLIISSTIRPLFSPFGYFGHIFAKNSSIVRSQFAKKVKGKCKRDVLYFTMDPVKHLESGNIQTRTELTAWVGADYNVQHVFPFLDYRVVDFAMSIPRHMFYKNGINRYAYRKAFEKILPPELCYYTPKDDIARITYFFEKRKNEEQESLEGKLDRELFAQYLDFAKLKELINGLKEEDRQTKHKIRQQIQICYSIQNAIDKAKKEADCKK